MARKPAAKTATPPAAVKSEGGAPTTKLPADLEKLIGELNDREAALNARAADLDAREALLDQRAASITEGEDALAANLVILKGDQAALADERAVFEALPPAAEPAPATAPATAPTPPAARTREPLKKGEVRISAKSDGYRRAGMAHTKKPFTHAAGKITVKQLARLQADPNVTVEVGE